jgi:hypothetical protein
MKHSGFLILVVLVSIALLGCTGTTSALTPPPPTLTPDIPPLPTKTRVILTTPQIPPPGNDTTPTPESGNVITDPILLKLVNEAKADLTTRANVSPDAITLKNAQAVEWGDTSLGCPAPGIFYAQMITPGYLIVLNAGGKEWEYHASTSRVMWCEK